MKFVLGLSDRLKASNCTTLDEKHSRGDPTEAYKIIRKENADCEKLLYIQLQKHITKNNILKRQAKFVADDIQIFFDYFSEKTSLDISCESSAKQMIHMKCRLVFSEKKKKNNNNNCRLLQLWLVH